MGFSDFESAISATRGNKCRIVKAAQVSMPLDDEVTLVIPMIQRTSYTFEGAIAVSTGHVYVGLSAFMGLMSGGEWKPLQHPHPLSVTEVPRDHPHGRGRVGSEAGPGRGGQADAADQRERPVGHVGVRP